MRVLAITHLADRATGLAGRALADRGVAVDVVNLPRAQRPPDLDDYGAVMTFGGQMSALDADRLRFVRDEISLLGKALDRGVPVLGFCLGAQLLAAAAGGAVRRLEQRVLDWVELVPTAEAADDPVFAALPDRCTVLEWHLDAIELPPEGVVLAETPQPGRSIFRIGDTAWGSQLHLEITPEMLVGWLDDPSERQSLREAGFDATTSAQEWRERLGDQMAVGQAVLSRFADVIAPAHAVP